jgi:hypothetical protein
MPRGGARPGAGRRRGSQDLVRRLRSERATTQAVEFLQTNGEAVFVEDSLAFAISIYKNEKLPLNVRMLAAGLALPFERPRLISANVAIRLPSEMSDEELLACIADYERTETLALEDQRAAREDVDAGLAASGIPRN